jgi:hypothetical protein
MVRLFALLAARPAATVSGVLVVLAVVQILLLAAQAEPVRPAPAAVTVSVPVRPVGPGTPAVRALVTALRTIGTYTQPAISITVNEPTLALVGSVPAGQGLVQVTGSVQAVLGLGTLTTADVATGPTGTTISLPSPTGTLVGPVTTTLWTQNGSQSLPSTVDKGIAGQVADLTGAVTNANGVLCAAEQAVGTAVLNTARAMHADRPAITFANPSLCPTVPLQ